MCDTEAKLSSAKASLVFWPTRAVGKHFLQMLLCESSVSVSYLGILTNDRLN